MNLDHPIPGFTVEFVGQLFVIFLSADPKI